MIEEHVLADFIAKQNEALVKSGAKDLEMCTIAVVE